MSRFGTTWRFAFAMIAIGGVLAFVGGLLLRLLDAPHAWTYVLIVAVTALVLLKITLLNGSSVTIEIRINPPEQPR